MTSVLLLFVALASSLAVFGAWGLVVFALTAGLAIYIGRVRCFRSLRAISLGAMLGLAILGALLKPGAQRAHEAALRAQCSDNLKRIALAVLMYESGARRFPSTYVADNSGKPLYSWRVLILPNCFIDYHFAEFDGSQPWDSPRNKCAMSVYHAPFVCPCDPIASAPGGTQTSYVAVVGENTAWPGKEPWKPSDADLARVASHTIIVVEVANSGIQWTEPRDLSLDKLGTPGALTVSSNHRPDDDFFFIYDRPGAHVATADGRVHYLPPSSLSTENLRKILQVGGYREEENGSGESAIAGGRRLNWPNIAALAVWLLAVGTLVFRAVRNRRLVRPAQEACGDGREIV